MIKSVVMISISVMVLVMMSAVQSVQLNDGCRFQLPGNLTVGNSVNSVNFTFDIMPLYRPEEYYIPVTGVNAANYTLNICAPLKTLCEGSNNVAGSTFLGGHCTSLGRADDFTVSALNSSDLGQGGLYLQYNGGDRSGVSKGYHALGIIINCSPQIQDIQFVNITTQSCSVNCDNQPDAIYYFTLSHPAACGFPPFGGLSGGSVFLIILFCSFGAYFLVGMLVNAFGRGKSGCDIIPNAEFWVSLPGLVKDGSLFIITCGSHAGSYKQV